MSRAVQAVIMAGGEGSRLRPLTSNMPKPMLSIANRPMMEHILTLLREHGFVDVVATVQFLSSVIRNYFSDGSDVGVSLSYSTEDVPLGTAGSVLNARDLLSGRILVISGDALTDLDLGKAVDFHVERGASATLVLKRMKDPLEFGIVMTSEDGRIERFLEKPTWGQVFSDTINTGIYVLEPEVLDLIPPEQPYDFSSELFPMMLDKGLPIFGYVIDEYWTDVGNTDAYLAAQRDALAGRVDLDIPGFEYRPEVWVGEGVEIDPTARIQGPAIIGDNCRIGSDAAVGPYAVVGANALIGPDAQVHGGAVVMERSHVGALAQVRGAVLGRGAALETGAILEEGAVIGDEATVGAGALVKSAVKVYTSRTVEAGAIVAQGVVAERRAHRSLFGARGVSGLVNVGVTPMLAVRLGMAYGSTLKPGSVVVTGRDASRAARTMKRAIIAGLNSTGVNCADLELRPLPLTRFTTRSQQASGGISVRTSPGHPEMVEIRLFDSDGADISESDQRKIDRIFFREDYRRVGPAKLGELEFPPHAPSQYTSGLLRALDLEVIRQARLKVVLDYAYGPACLVGPSVIGRLGCDMLAVHAFADEHRPALQAEDLEEMLSDLCDHVGNSGSDVGALIEPGGEIVHLVDDRGRLVGHDRALLAFLGHQARDGGTVAVSVNCSMRCEEIVRRAGASLQWTTTALTDLMNRAQLPEVAFAGNSEGVLIFPAFLPAPDGLMTFGKTLEMVASSGRRMSELVDEIPETHIERRDIHTPWDVKGSVMRRLSSRSEPGELVLLDGVKVVQEDGWALVVPLADEPKCRIWAEAGSRDAARELADRYARIVEGVVNGTSSSLHDNK